MNIAISPYLLIVKLFAQTLIRLAFSSIFDINYLSDLFCS